MNEKGVHRHGSVLMDYASGGVRPDDVTCAEKAGILDEAPGIFALMDPKPGAIDGIHKRAARYDVYILSTAPWKNPSA